MVNHLIKKPEIKIVPTHDFDVQEDMAYFPNEEL